MGNYTFNTTLWRQKIWFTCALSGDEVLQLNGQPMRGLTHKEALSKFRQLKKGPVTIVFIRRSRSRAPRYAVKLVNVEDYNINLYFVSKYSLHDRSASVGSGKACQLSLPCLLCIAVAFLTAITAV